MESHYIIIHSYSFHFLKHILAEKIAIYVIITFSANWKENTCIPSHQSVIKPCRNLKQSVKSIMRKWNHKKLIWTLVRINVQPGINITTEPKVQNSLHFPLNVMTWLSGLTFCYFYLRLYFHSNFVLTGEGNMWFVIGFQLHIFLKINNRELKKHPQFGCQINH